MIRRGKMVDIPALLALLKEGHGRSKYAGTARVDVNYAKHLLAEMLNAQDNPSPDNTFCFVWEEGGQVRGMHFAMKQRIYLIAHELTAMEAFFYVSPGSSPFAWMRLYMRFARWAASDPRVIEIQPSCSNVVAGMDWQKLAQVYERQGFKQTGAILSRDIERRVA